MLRNCLLFSCSLLLACSSSEDAPGTGGSSGAAGAAGTGGTMPAEDAAVDVAPDTAAETSVPDAPDPDAGVDADPGQDAASDAGPVGPARCGATAFDWLQSNALGDILEKHTKAPHSKFELGAAILKLQSDGELKTKRLPKVNTRAELIRYQTQDRGSLIDATALVTYPSSSGTYPILLILHGTAGFSDGCAPTLGMVESEYGGFDDELGILMSVYASFGYITVFPDYIGLKSLGGPTGFLHPYLVAEPTAIASIDSVRATKKLLAGGGVTPGDVVVIGGSQGGHAAAFVNRYLPHYAPEIVIKGSVWDVPPTNLLAHSHAALNSWVNATSNTIAFFTTADSWYQGSSGVGEVFASPFDTQVPDHISTKCGGMKIDTPTLETVFTPEVLAAAKEPDLGGFEPWACYLKENSLTMSSVPKQENIPSLFLLGELDTLVNPEIERAAFQELCGLGYDLVYLECAGASHTKPLVWAFDQTLDFLEARLRGDPLPAHTCQLKPAETCTSQP